MICIGFQNLPKWKFSKQSFRHFIVFICGKSSVSVEVLSYFHKDYNAVLIDFYI